MKLFRSRFLAALLALTFASPVRSTLVVDYYVIGNTADITEIYYLQELMGVQALYDMGIYGSTAVVANIEAGFANVNNSPLGTYPPTRLPKSSDALPDFVDGHATATMQLLAGRGTLSENTGTFLWELGMAPLATAYTGSVATLEDGNGGFGYSSASLLTPYYWAVKGWTDANGTHAGADVINSSYGGSTATDGYDWQSLLFDALIYENKYLQVFSAGNTGDEPLAADRAVLAPASAYNTLSVGALQIGNGSETQPYGEIADFSSRGAAGFFLPDNAAGSSGTMINEARAAVDIVAPGTGYLFTVTGSNITNVGDGTSYAAPAVAGGLALLTDLARQFRQQVAFDNVNIGGFIQLNGVHVKADMEHALVLKAVLLASANRGIAGWNNGQALDQNGVITTTQALDLTLGAGVADFESAARLLTSINFHNLDQSVLTLSPVDGISVGNSGWALNTIADGTAHHYLLTDPLHAGDVLSLSLVWFVEAMYQLAAEPAYSGAEVDLARLFYGSFANLDLQLYYKVTEAGEFLPYAQSVSLYNNTEFLSLTIPFEAWFRITITANGHIYNFTGADGTEYALAWDVVSDGIGTPSAGSGEDPAIPEPAMCAVFMGIFGVVMAANAKRRRRGA